MSVTELSRIDRTVDILAPIERVWRALTNASELATWFQVRIEGDLAVGHEAWMTSTHPQHGGQRFLVRVTEMSAPHRFVWEWHPGEVDPTLDYSREPRTTVTFALERLGGGTRLTVSETGFDAISLTRRAKVFKDNTEGWAEVLTWLQNHAQNSR